MNHPINKNYKLTVEDIAKSFPYFTIVIGCYNKQNIIGKCVELLQLAGLNQKIILIDDASTDGTFNEIKEIPNVHVIKNDTNIGWGASNNKALALVDTKYVVFMDADCFVGSFGWLINWYLLAQNKNNIGESGEFHYCKSLYDMPYIYDHLIIQPWNKKINKSKNSIEDIGHIGGNYKIFETDIIKKLGGFSDSRDAACVEVTVSLKIKASGYELMPYRMSDRLTVLKGDPINVINQKYEQMKHSIIKQKSILIDNGVISGFINNPINLVFDKSIYSS